MMGLLEKLGRYYLTAGAAAILDVGVFLMLMAAGLPLPPAATLSFIAAAALNYQLTSRYVFRAEATWRGFGLFFCGALGGLGINVLVTVLAATQLGLSPVLAKIAAVGTAFFANFLINAVFVFRR